MICRLAEHLNLSYCCTTLLNQHWSLYLMIVFLCQLGCSFHLHFYKIVCLYFKMVYIKSLPFGDSELASEFYSIFYFDLDGRDYSDDDTSSEW